EKVEKTKEILYKRPLSKQSCKDEFRRPSYSITPTLIYPDKHDEVNQKQQALGKNKDSEDNDGAESEDSVVEAHKKGLKRKSKAQPKEKPKRARDQK
ncbi:hypothetical protein BX616_007871, partial [Lobosporangium transversale]